MDAVPNSLPNEPPKHEAPRRQTQPSGVPAVIEQSRHQHLPRWLAAQELPADEREMVEACLRGIDHLDQEVVVIDRALAELVLASPELRRLMTLPGTNYVNACALLGAIGDIKRFPTARAPRQLSRSRSQSAPVGLRARTTRTDLQTRPG
jgi:transposase